jgi:hypothetical protein
MCGVYLYNFLESGIVFWTVREMRGVFTCDTTFPPDAAGKEQSRMEQEKG